MNSFFRYTFFVFLLGNVVLFSSSLSAGGNDHVIYKYKKYEKFNLGELEIKGSLVAPGDLTISKRKVKKFDLDLYERKHFRDFISAQIDELR